MINSKSGKYFIPSGFVNEVEKIKKLAISHGVLALLYHLFHETTTDYTIKRAINSKILSYVSQEDLEDQIEVLEGANLKQPVQLLLGDSKTPKKSIPKSPQAKRDRIEEPGLEITGSGYSKF